MPIDEIIAAVTGMAKWSDLKVQGKHAEAERQRQLNQTMFANASKVLGMGVQREELRLSRLAGQRAEQLLPGQMEVQKQQIAAGEVDIATGEQQLEERKVAFEQQQDLYNRLSAATGEPPGFFERVAKGDASREEIEQYKRRRQIGAVEQEVATAYDKQVAEQAEALRKIPMLDEIERNLVAQTNLLISQAKRQNAMADAEALEGQAEKRMRQMFTAKQMNPDEIEFQMAMVKAGFWDNPDEIRDKLRAVDVVIAQVQQKSTYEEAKQGSTQNAGALGIDDEAMKWATLLMGQQAVGAITPENKEAALRLLTKTRNAILQSAQERFSYEDFTTTITPGAWEYLPHGAGTTAPAETAPQPTPRPPPTGPTPEEAEAIRQQIRQMEGIK